MENKSKIIVNYNGSKFYYLRGKLHREDGPALEYHDGIKFWYMHGKLHREDGPAIEFANGEKRWYLHNLEYSFNNWLKKLNVSLEEKTLLGLKYANTSD